MQATERAAAAAAAAAASGENPHIKHAHAHSTYTRYPRCSLHCYAVSICIYLGAEAVPPARGLLLVVVEVGAGEEVAEDELGDVDVVLIVHLDGDPGAVVPHRDSAAVRVHGHLGTCVGVDRISRHKVRVLSGDR